MVLSLVSGFGDDKSLQNDTRDLSNSNDSRLDTETIISDQLNKFLNTIALSDAEVKQRNAVILEDLEKVIRPLLQRCKLYTFGSTETGLGLKNADTDIYLNPGKPIVDNAFSPIGPHVARLSNLLSTIAKLLYEYPKVFGCIISVSSARVPIIKFQHIPTKVSCDLSFTSLIGVKNSKLIKYYLSIDSRFRHLMIIIKYWVQHCGTKSALCINNYTLNLLFIFFLQNVKLVPSIYDLQRQCAKPFLLNSWQVNFSEQCPYFHSDQDFEKKSIPELLGEFFKFYANYDFENNLICPLTGKSYGRDIIIEKIPSFLFRYSNYLNCEKDPKQLEVFTAMCVQDPFELNYNVSRAVVKSHVEKFQIFCSVGSLMVQESAKNSYRNFFSQLFPEMNISDILSSTESFNISFEAAEFLISNIIGKRCYEDFIRYQHQKWFEYMFDSIMIFIKKVLNFDVVSDDVSYQFCNDEENAEHPVISIKCNGKFIEALFNRIKSDNTAKGVRDPLKRRIAISKAKLSVLNNSKKSPETDDASVEKEFKFKFKAFKRTSPTVHIYMIFFNDGGDKKLFKHSLLDIFNTTMRSLLKKSFKHNISSKKL
ncbi:terminal uridylyltransferase Tailor-like isoform X2 [Trichogramma pretiosum]|nr:terminal uridylyltransferase Tailor-like isoform X2 [Trichogramma pretiosum]XP_014238182.1 terminal uridylyltransferase Tailor-like isoform X2 [Trichogramma pretiosum]